MLAHTLPHPENKLIFPNLLNARDLGGYATIDGDQTRWKSLLRADELTRLTPAGVSAVLDYGVRTVIDLRWRAEAESQPSVFQQGRLPAKYVHVSLLGSSEEAWRARRPEATKETWNGVVLDYAQCGIGEVMRAIAYAPEGGVLFHCLAGKDRTGIVAGLLLALAEVEPHVIGWDYALTTDNLREAYLAADPDNREAVLERVRCPPEGMHNMLAHLAERYGGVQNYLHEIGLSEREIRLVRSRLRLESKAAL